MRVVNTALIAIDIMTISRKYYELEKNRCIFINKVVGSVIVTLTKTLDFANFIFFRLKSEKLFF